MATPKRDVALALLAFCGAFVLWQFSPLVALVYPLRLFVTSVHELGHGLAAIVTGGEFVRFEVQSNGAGLAYSRGGIREIIIAAGYVGTAIFGAVLLFTSNRVRRPEMVAVGLGIAFAGLTLLYSGLAIGHLNTLERVVAFGLLLVGGGYFLVTPKNLGRWRALGIMLMGLLTFLFWAAGDNSLTVIVGVMSGVLLIYIGYLGVLGHRDVTLFTLNFLAFVVGLNAITDAWFLLRIVRNDRLIIRNDASAMADVTGVSATVWAAAWILLAITLLGGAIWVTFVRPQKRLAS